MGGRTRLQVLETSLINKKTKLDERFKNHFEDVASANGQLMNDKRNRANPPPCRENIFTETYEEVKPSMRRSGEAPAYLEKDMK